jgi:hypothetical protein
MKKYLKCKRCKSIRSALGPILQPVWCTTNSSIAETVAPIPNSFTHLTAWLSFFGEGVRSAHPTPNATEPDGQTCTFLTAVTPPALTHYALAHSENLNLYIIKRTNPPLPYYKPK